MLHKTPSKLISDLTMTRTDHTWFSKLSKAHQQYVREVVCEMRKNPEVPATAVATALVTELDVGVSHVTVTRTLRWMVHNDKA
jgi:response regulator of citrate/malate metabolism